MTERDLDDFAEPTESIHGTFSDIGTALKKSPRWVIEPVLPEGLVLMAGPPKAAYKSTITMAMSAIIASYKCLALPADWKPRQPGPIMIISHEADAGELRYIMEDGLGVKLRKDESIITADEPEKFRLDDEEGQKNLRFWLGERRPILCILDPLANSHGLEEKDAGEMINLIAPIRRQVKEMGSCFLIVHHTRKIDDDRQYRPMDMRGTSALPGLADGLLSITPTPNPYEVIINGQFKKAREWTKTICLGVWERKGQRGGEPLREIDKMVLRGIGNGFVTPETLAKHLNLLPKSVGDRLVLLEKLGHIKMNKAGDSIKILQGE